MATLIGENVARKYSVSTDSRTATREFYVRAASKTDDGPDVLDAVGVDRGDAHPRSPSIYAMEFSATQDDATWWKWVVTVSYSRPDSQEDPATNPNANPLMRDAEISYSTESIMVAARGEVDSGGATTSAILTSAGEPYDPVPEEELEILIISIVRWETPGFSLALYYSYQNAVNSNSFTFGDLTIQAGFCKVRMAIGKTEKFIDPDENVIPFRQYQYTLAVNPLGWDIELLDWGTYYDDGASIKRFLETEQKEFGLLDGSGDKLPDGDPEVFNTWENKKRVSFVALSLPAGP